MGLRWHEAGERGTRGVASDTSTLTLHVLTAVGFGQAYDFNSKTQKLPAGHTMSYRDVLQMCISKIFYLSLTPTFLQTCSFMPARLKTIYRAGHELRKYMEDLLAAESKSNKGMSNTLIGGLAKASLQDDTAALSLSNEEVMGNIFIFSLAGHETTAGAVSASLLLLAAHEDVQQKLILEIDAVLQDHSIEDYANVFPRLQYCLAIMVISSLSHLPPALSDTRSTKHYVSTAPSLSFPKTHLPTIAVSISTVAFTYSLHAQPSTSTSTPCTPRPTHGVPIRSHGVQTVGSRKHRPATRSSHTFPAPLCRGPTVHASASVGNSHKSSLSPCSLTYFRDIASLHGLIQDSRSMKLGVPSTPSYETAR